jgi:hypothetical protein
MPLPNTRVIPTGWSAHHRAAAAGGMNARCELRPAATGEPVYDPDTGLATRPVPDAAWTGACRVQALTGDAHTTPQVENPVTTRGYLVQLDESDPTAGPVPDVGEDWTVKVIAAVNDARLIGRSLSVLDVQYGSERFTRDLVCLDNLG